jgi:uncharacterized surface protein with fasciclin (FAS1) repeats
MTILRRTVLAATAALGLGTASQAQSIAEVAAADGRFDTLVAAVTAAGLADTLSGPGDFTVFAPTDDAFAALPPGVVETLLQPENLRTLTNILLYHVDDGALPASTIPAGTTQLVPLYNFPLCVTNSGGSITLGDGSGAAAAVVVADVAATNGVIHAIDKVLIPTGHNRCH